MFAEWRFRTVTWSESSKLVRTSKGLLPFSPKSSKEEVSLWICSLLLARSLYGSNSPSAVPSYVMGHLVTRMSGNVSNLVSLVHCYLGLVLPYCLLLSSNHSSMTLKPAPSTILPLTSSSHLYLHRILPTRSALPMATPNFTTPLAFL